MINKKKLPKREFKIKENGKEFGDLDDISIVDDPAIESAFMLFNKSDLSIFAAEPVKKTDLMQITGPVMIPDKEMLRKDPTTGDYFMGWFSEQTILECVQNYFRRGRNRRSNLNHTEEYTRDLFVFESWIVTDPKNDKANALGFKDVVKGTWYVTFQIISRELWDKIKNGNFKGFSVEVEAAMFSLTQDPELKLREIIYSDSLSEFEKEYLIYELIKEK
jgi:hypothetical protein